MIVLGKVQTLKAVRRTDFGVYLKELEGTSEEEVFIPRQEVEQDLEMGAELSVFVYRDTEDRLIATVHIPKLTLGNVAKLKVVDVTSIGAFLEWGLQKDLFLPFKQQVGKPQKDQEVLVGLYIDKSDRLCATMKIYDMLKCDAPYKQNQSVSGIVYSIKPELGALVAVEDGYHGLIPTNEMMNSIRVGDQLNVRVKNIRPDGKLVLSLRKQAFQQMEDDATKVMNLLEAQGGTLALGDKSSPQEIKAQLGISKASFKRAIGRLLKEGAISLTDTGIKRNW
ncbi:CvfB family protein [Niameybacter massiliensis]|uniref:CvfB family protein n=1 Tax=Niameybacter massiliensis TaxID=1658108 RepID=UPI0006B4F3C0|nr:S1-like domain-containing RNA-binding protein [Niameybacter massiliensis]